MTFTLPGPTPDSYWGCYHEFIAQALPLPVKMASYDVGLKAGRQSRKIVVAVLAGKAILIGNPATLTKRGRNRVLKVRRRALRMTADRARFTLFY